MRKLFFLLALLPVFVWESAPALWSAEISPAKVWIVCNAADKESLEIADFYRSARNIPQGNIIALKNLPKRGLIGRDEYYKLIENPLLAALVEKGAIDAPSMAALSADGREQRVFLSHDVDFIVVCRGVPWGIKSTDAELARNLYRHSGSTDSASVDSELSARFLFSKGLGGGVKNPLFNRGGEVKDARVFRILRVARLDGASKDDVLNSVKSGLRAELLGARGTVCLDLYKKIPAGDAWYAAAANILSDMGFEVFSDDAVPMMSFDRRFDNVLFYLGWYDSSPKAYMSAMKTPFADGAVALHIYSFSAINLRDTKNWTANAVERGAAATVGNVFEPFLGGVHNPEIFVRSLALGACAGEAAYASLPELGWQAVSVGDPLYKPFAVPLEEQLAAIEQGKIDDLSQYAVIRKMNLLKTLSGSEAAEEFGKKYIGKIPDTALLWKLICDARTRGENLEAFELADALLAENSVADPRWRGLAMEFAAFLETGKRFRAEDALKIYSDIAKLPDMTTAFDRKLLPRAKKLSDKLGEELGAEFDACSMRIAKDNARLAAAKKAREDAKKAKVAEKK